MFNDVWSISSTTAKQIAHGNMFILRSIHAQKGFKSSPEDTAIPYIDTKTLVTSDIVPEIAAVSSINTETAYHSIMLQNVGNFSQIQMTKKD